MRPGLPGIGIDTTIFRPATFVEQAIDNLSHSLLLGVLMMVLVLGLFLFDWRSALISAVTIPLSLIAAWYVLYLRGATVNTMVLAGLIIALGAVVDDAIVDVENIIRRLRIHRKESDDRSIRTTAKIVFDASLEVRGAVVYASLIEALALLPIFFLQGLTGSFFRPLAMAYALAVLVSLLVALIWTPAMALILLRKAPLERRESPIVRGLQSWVRLDAGAHREDAAPRLRDRRGTDDRRRARPAAGRAVAPARLQGEGFPDALGHGAGDVARGGGSDLHTRQSPSCCRSRGSGTPARTSARRSSPTKWSG